MRQKILFRLIVFITLFAALSKGQDKITIHNGTDDNNTGLLISENNNDNEGWHDEGLIIIQHETQNGESIITSDSPVMASESSSVETTDKGKDETMHSIDTDANITNNQKLESNYIATDVEEKKKETPKEESLPIHQRGPFIDLLGGTLLSLEMTDHVELRTHYTNKALHGKKVIGLYFSADW